MLTCSPAHLVGACKTGWQIWNQLEENHWRQLHQTRSSSATCLVESLCQNHPFCQTPSHQLQSHQSLSHRASLFHQSHLSRQSQIPCHRQIPCLHLTPCHHRSLCTHPQSPSTVKLSIALANKINKLNKINTNNNPISHQLKIQPLRSAKICSLHLTL